MNKMFTSYLSTLDTVYEPVTKDTPSFAMSVCAFIFLLNLPQSYQTMVAVI